MIILDGNNISERRADILKDKVSALSFVPKLIIFQVGNRSDSESFIKRKIAFGQKIGVETEVVNLPESISEGELVEKVKEYNANKDVNGIIVQLPLPESINSSLVINTIDQKKDVDGLSADNVRRLMNNEKGIVPATAKGILSLLKEYNIEVSGKKVVVVGRSLLVGKSTSFHLLNNDATVTICHSKTPNLKEYTKEADILIIAIGQPKMIDSSYVKDGQIVIDVGISKYGEGQIVGDVNLEDLKDKVSAISPVPGGVGPMTVLSLFENLLENL